MNGSESDAHMINTNAAAIGEEGDLLQVDEIRESVKSLSSEEKLKLHEIERIRRGGTAFGEGDLLQEALCRALEGDRKCPRGVGIIEFLAMTMRSIASHSRQKDQGTVFLESPEEASPAHDALWQSTGAPEQIASAEDVLQGIFTMFESDNEATLVLMGWADGLQGKDLRDATGLDQASLDYASKRVRAGVRSTYPEGWKP